MVELFLVTIPTRITPIVTMFNWMILSIALEKKKKKRYNFTSSTLHPTIAAFSCFNDVTSAAGLARPPSQTEVSWPRPTKGSEFGFGTTPRRTHSLSCLWRRLKSVWMKKILVEILPFYPFYINESHRFYGENSQNYRRKLKILLEKNFWISFYFNVYFRFCSKVWFVFFPFSLRYTPFRLRKDNNSLWCLIKLTFRWYTLFPHRSAHP